MNPAFLVSILIAHDRPLLREGLLVILGASWSGCRSHASTLHNFPILTRKNCHTCILAAVPGSRSPISALLGCSKIGPSVTIIIGAYVRSSIRLEGSKRFKKLRDHTSWLRSIKCSTTLSFTAETLLLSADALSLFSRTCLYPNFIVHRV